MVHETKKKLFAAVAGVVVGAGAVIAGAVALADKKNQDKVSKIIAKGQQVVKRYVNTANKQVDKAEKVVAENINKGRKTAKSVVNKTIKSAEKATKVAKREVRKI